MMNNQIGTDSDRRTEFIRKFLPLYCRYTMSLQGIFIPVHCRWFTFSAVATGALLLSGCTTSVQPVNPPERITAIQPDSWAATESAPETRFALISTENPHDWIRRFNDSTLDALISEALRHNPDLKIAAARLESARQILRSTRADLYPSLGMEASGSRTESRPRAAPTLTTDVYSLGLGASWELDLWGRIRNDASAAAAEQDATGFDLLQARHALIAGVGSTWYQTIAAAEQLQLAHETLENYRSTTSLIQNRFERGIDSALDYRLAAANAATAESTLARREEAFKRSLRALQILIGRYPDAELEVPSQLPDLLENAPAGIPAQVIERRPDVRAAIHRIAAASHAIKASSRVRLPSIQLTGSAGLQSEAFRDLLDGDTEYWNVALTVNQPMFTGGRLDANVDRARALYEQAQARYEQVVLQAFFEIEHALDADLTFASLERSAQEAARQSAEAEQLAWQQYTSGLINIVTVLESQRFALNARQSLIEARNARLQNRIQLFLALGGDA